MSSNLFWCPECKCFGGWLAELWPDSACSGTPIDLLAEREELLGWIRGADHYSNCPGGYWPHPCKCGLTELLARHAAGGVSGVSSPGAPSTMEAEHE